MRRRLIRKVCHWQAMAQYARQASSVYRVNRWRLFLRTLPLCRRHQYDANEAFRLGLFDPHLNPDKLACYCSRKRLTTIQKSLTPPALVPLIRNKAVFYRLCLAHRVPVPALYALFFRGAPGWTFRTPAIAQAREWETFFERDVPAEFVVKPIEAAFGRGLNIYQRQGDRFADTFENVYSTDEIRRHLCVDDYSSGFIVQERLRNHPKLMQLTGTSGLQTARLNTLIDRKGACRIIHAHFKLIVGDNITDNFHYGDSGNVQARIDLGDGHLYNAVTASPGIPGFQAVEKHPDTGKTLEGFSLPYWPEACHLVKRIAPLFLPLQAIGWDVALTPSGPVIIEGNAWWDPPNPHGNLDSILRQLKGVK